jgi:hypothetical protein
MNISRYVLNKMTLFEKIKFCWLQRCYVRSARKMDDAIKRGDRERAYRYEDKIYIADEKLETFADAMSKKYVY